MPDIGIIIIIIIIILQCEASSLSGGDHRWFK